MPAESYPSPNAIPPRTSSNGVYVNGVHPQKPVLKPLAETDWMSQGGKKYTHLTGDAPPAEPSNDLGNDLIHQAQSGEGWKQEKEKIVVAPYEYLLGHPGKDVRSQMIAAFNVWLQVPEEPLKVIQNVVGMLHTASLLIDDVEDNSILRRGIPVANRIFGTAQTINSANYVYFLALQELTKLNSPGMVKIYTEELINLHRGQGCDLFWRDTLTCPSEEDYLEMVHQKTGGLFRLAIKLMQEQSPTGLECTPLVNTLGLLFQIRDDELNLMPRYEAAKGFCEDLTEGKFSFPVIHAIRSDPSNLTIINILKQKTTDDSVKRFAVAFMERAGSFEYTRKSIDILQNKAQSLVKELEDQAGPKLGPAGGAGIRKILDKLTT